MESETIRNLLLGFGAAALVCLGLAILFLVVAVVQLRRIRVPAGAGFGETLLYVPLTVVLFLDLLDFALDIFAAPLAWAILSWLGLPGLRGVAVVEGLLPFTNLIPLMTASWLAVRLLGRDNPLIRRYDDYQQYTTIDQPKE